MLETQSRLVGGVTSTHCPLSQGTALSCILKQWKEVVILYGRAWM